MRSEWINFFNLSLHARGTDDLIDADELRETIKKHDGSEAYHCAFDLQWKSLQTDGGQPTVKDYKGIYRPAMGYVWFDFDSHDGGETALNHARECLHWLERDGVLVFYSGSKGFHLAIPFSLFDLKESERLGDELKLIAAKLKKDRWSSLDTTVFNPQRKFRALGSKHQKTGLYKIALDHRLFLELSLAEIRTYAKARGDLGIPVPQVYEAKIFAASLPANSETVSPEIANSFAPNDGRQAFKKCGFLKHCADEPTKINEAQWYAALSVVARFTEGRKQAHAISSGHPKYSPQETNEKVDHALQHGPRTCENINQLWDGCKKCPLFGQIKSPVSIYAEDKPQAKKELQVAKELVAKFEGNFLRQEKNLFQYSHGFWKEVSITQIDSIKKHVMEMFGGLVTSRTVDSTFKTFFRELPAVPEHVNLFDPNPFCINFLNGTLHARQSKDYTYSLEFLPHRKDDYVNTQLPYNYNAESKVVNEPFQDMLLRVFAGDPDSAEKIRSVRQMFGACLMPAFPHFFFLWGAPGTGKSTVMQIAAKLVSEKNVCSVEPSEFSGFNMESMVGKLVNLETDVSMNAPITDSQLKKIVDRRKMRIRRKGIADAYGLLPAIHLFGGNAIPPTLEGAHGAHDRRWTFLEFKQVQTKGLYNKEFHHWVFDQSPEGVLNFALEGLSDLLASRGHYLQPESGKQKMKAWQAEKDTLALFLGDVERGALIFGEDDRPHTQLRISAGKKIRRSKFYSIYSDWAETVGVKHSRKVDLLTRPELYAKLEARGYPTKLLDGYDMIEGFELGPPANSEW